MRQVQHEFRGIERTWEEWAELLNWKMDNLLYRTRSDELDDLLEFYWERIERNFKEERTDNRTK